MRIGALLFVGIGVLSAAACSVNTSSDDVCTAGGGICIQQSDAGGIPEGCGEQISGALCDNGYVCCLGGAPVPAPPYDAGDAATDTSAPTTADAATKG